MLRNDEDFFIKVITARILNREICESHRISFGDNKVTPEEEYFKKLFNHEQIFVKDMNDLELNAHIDELEEIAKEARIRFYAAKDARTSRKPKGPQGFQKSVNSDVTTTDAINSIKERQTKLSKADKVMANLMKLPGIDEATAQKLMSAGTILAQLRKHGDTLPAVPASNNGNDEIKEEKPKTKIFNPFEKKE